MTTQRWILAFCFSLASVFGTVKLFKTNETQTYTCRTFGSGIVQPFKGESYYVRSDCQFRLISFTVNQKEYSVTIRRGHNGLLVQVKIIINKVTTLLQNGHVVVKNKKFELRQKTGLGHRHQWRRQRLKCHLAQCTWANKLSVGHRDELIRDSKLHDHKCNTSSPVLQKNDICRQFFQEIKDCVQYNNSHYQRLCEENIFGFENNQSVFCPFFKEFASQCNQSRINRFWRGLTKCEKPRCPGDLIYRENGPAVIPSCSNPKPLPFYQELTESCACPEGKVLNNGAKGYRCIPWSNCSCEFAGKSYRNGEIRRSKCHSCTCHGVVWRCSENFCHRRCVIEGPFVTTFDGKKYVLPYKCAYLASKGPSWRIRIHFSRKGLYLRKVVVRLPGELIVFRKNKVLWNWQEITQFHQFQETCNAKIYWVSSTFLQVHTTSGLFFQIQLSPEIQLFIDAPNQSKSDDKIEGLCGNSNRNTTDDFTTETGFFPNSVQLFALSWIMGNCQGNIPTTCTKRENENYAHEKCAVLKQPTGVFSQGHPRIPTDYYYKACIQRICNSGRSQKEALCIGLASYAKACAGVGVVIGDWKKNMGCA
uniref:Spiggin C2 alternatively spliced variant 3 n=1 Tax=Gasterosteus aculeatus TaxID=69293 RepID=A0A0H5BJR8_GASAC|nr:spiggin C2 alternatively spliced variant 3 [Gasterosteus aculeatus]